MPGHALDPLFSPRGIAVFGASPRPDSVGGRVFANLVEGGYGERLFAINPAHETIGDYPCHSSLEEVKDRVDLAVIATPAPTVADIVRECGEQFVRAAIVLSAGFSEAGQRGEELTRAVLREARANDLRILGPNCLGLMNPHHRLNATFSRNRAHPGTLALVSQSGALCTAILDWAAARRVGFSNLVSLGEAADVGFGDVLDYLALDPHTEAILLYVEGVRHPRRFMSGLRVAARLKPVVVVKAGRHAESSRAAQSHTGALVGADDAFDAALRRAGAVRATTIPQLFAAAQLLSTHRDVRDNRLAIVTNAGGPGVMATDRAVELDVRMAELDPGTLEALDAALPSTWSHGNPVDIIGDATPERYEAAVSATLADRGVDGLLVMLTPQAMTNPDGAAQAVIEASRRSSKPVLTCWMGELHVDAARRRFDTERVPTFTSPEAAVEAFSYLTRYRNSQQLLLQVPDPLLCRDEPDVAGARLVIESALADGRDALSTLEAKALLRAFHIPVTQSIAASSPNEALVAAESLGLPVAMKVDSPDILHKSDVGGVHLDIRSPHDVRSVYTELVEQARRTRPDAHVRGVTIEPMARRPNGREVQMGVVQDAALGPVIAFGAGGTAVEVLQDRAVALPPLNEFIARDMIQQTRAHRLLGEFRGMPAADLGGLVVALLRLSELVCELPHVREVDVNPLLVDENGVVAVDARILVHRPPPALERYGHLAIPPYPAALARHVQLADGTDIVLRPIRPEDAQLEQTFVRNLSDRTKRFRFMHSLTELTREMLVRFTQIDYDREMAFVAVTRIEGRETEVGVGRYVTNPDGRTAEFALVVADAWQGRGIGTKLMERLIEVARDRGLRELRGEVLADNAPMLELMRDMGFSIRPHRDDEKVRTVAKLLGN